MPEILAIEDEKDIVDNLEYNFKKEGFRVARAYDGISGLRQAKDKLPSLIILDLMLPGIAGLDVCRELKKDPRTAAIPIIMLTAKSGEADRVVGLELGADDYIVKPFSVRELLARVKAVMKRYGKKEETAEPILKFPDLEIDVERHAVTALGKPVDFTAKEFSLLRFLAENKDKVYSREKLLDRIWGVEVAIETRTVDVHIRRLREKLGKAARHLKTLRGVGYKWA